MEKTLSSKNHPVVSAQPRLHQSAPEIQAYGTVSHILPLELEEPVRLEMTERLNQLLADTITLRVSLAGSWPNLLPTPSFVRQAL
jgi:hypothetical protein